MRRAAPVASFTTMGQSKPASLTQGTSWRHQGRPAGWPYDPATHDNPRDNQSHKGGSDARKKERERKLAIFTAARARGLDVVAAGEEVGVKDKTAYRYETERKERLAEQQRGGTA